MARQTTANAKQAQVRAFAILRVSSLAEHRQDRLREERGEAQHGDGVGAGEPQLRPEQVEVEHIADRVEETHAQEERRDLGKEQLAHGEIFSVFETRGDKEGAEHALNCLKRVVLRRPEAGDPRMRIQSLLLAGALALHWKPFGPIAAVASTQTMAQKTARSGMTAATK